MSQKMARRLSLCLPGGIRVMRGMDDVTDRDGRWLARRRNLGVPDSSGRAVPNSDGSGLLTLMLRPDVGSTVRCRICHRTDTQR